MDMEALQTMNPMVWIILISAVIISIAVLFNKAVKFLLKLAVLIVVAMFAVYFLVQANVIVLPTIGK